MTIERLVSTTAVATAFLAGLTVGSLLMEAYLLIMG